MKKKIMVGIILIAVVFVYFCMKPVTFEKNSVYLVFSNYETKEIEGRAIHSEVVYHGMKKVSLESISDLAAVKNVDPAYRLDAYDETAEGLLLNKVYTRAILVNVTENNAVEYSKITYRNLGSDTIADVGKHHYEIVSTPVIRLMTMRAMTENERKYKMWVNAEDMQVTKVEFANPDVTATLSDLKEKEPGVYSFVIHVAQLPEDIESFQTSMKFTVLEKGEEKIRYGDGRLSIRKNSIGLDYIENSTVLYH